MTDRSPKSPKSSNKFGVLIGVSLVVLTVLGIAVWSAMRASNGEAERQRLLTQVEDGVRRGKSRVVRLTRDVAANKVISPEDMEEEELAVDKIPESAVSIMSLDVGSYAAFDLKAGDLLLIGQLKRQRSAAPEKAAAKAGVATANAKHHSAKSSHGSRHAK